MENSLWGENPKLQQKKRKNRTGTKGSNVRFLNEFKPNIKLTHTHTHTHRSAFCAHRYMCTVQRTIIYASEYSTRRVNTQRCLDMFMLTNVWASGTKLENVFLFVLFSFVFLWHTGDLRTIWAKVSATDAVLMYWFTVRRISLIQRWASRCNRKCEIFISAVFWLV